MSLLTSHLSSSTGAQRVGAGTLHKVKTHLHEWISRELCTAQEEAGDSSGPREPDPGSPGSRLRWLLMACPTQLPGATCALVATRGLAPPSTRAGERRVPSASPRAEDYPPTQTTAPPSLLPSRSCRGRRGAHGISLGKQREEVAGAGTEPWEERGALLLLHPLFAARN